MARQWCRFRPITARRSAIGAITLIIHMLALLTGTTVQTGSPAVSLSARVPGRDGDGGTGTTAMAGTADGAGTDMITAGTAVMDTEAATVAIVAGTAADTVAHMVVAATRADTGAVTSPAEVADTAAMDTVAELVAGPMGSLAVEGTAGAAASMVEEAASMVVAVDSTVVVADSMVAEAATVAAVTGKRN